MSNISKSFKQFYYFSNSIKDIVANMQGKLIIISAPSGAGKTSIVHRLLEDNLPLEFSISACSRQKREHEMDGKDYYFLSPEDFKIKINNNEFLEWEEVYNGSFYGTLKSELERIWIKNKHVLFDVDVKGGVNIKRKFPQNSLSIFIQTPSIAELENRLRKRGTETEESIIKRVSKANQELEFMPQFDKIVINDNLDKATADVKKLIEEFLNNEKA